MPEAKVRRPEAGAIVHVRTRTYVVEEVETSGAGTLVRMVCLDDDALEQPLDVIWELELDARVEEPGDWFQRGKRFDDPARFSAYLHALKWNCVTATDPELFQSPFRAGIQIDAYQLEPLRKALQLPRVNMFIADDVGLGKTIEAGLIASELLLRRRVREVVVTCPPSMLSQWKEELEARFGLTFEILDRDYFERARQQRGYGVNPWTTFPRFLVSYHLLTDETYAGPLRAWLGGFRSRTLLIFDEAHHAAPASGQKYAIDSRITRAIRDLASRFEHRLFLSATPHNGHSNSFAALLEILDPNRFMRGVKVTPNQLQPIMVRRLKEDIRALQGGFPKRVVRQMDIGGLPEDAPELRLSQLLNEYREVHGQRNAGLTRAKQARAGLAVIGLQQRLLSSVEAFARTLEVHRRTMEKVWGADVPEVPTGRIDLSAPGSDDDRSLLAEEELAMREAAEFERATAAGVGDAARADPEKERQLIEEMAAIAGASRGEPDARVRLLISWMQGNMCPGIHPPNAPPAAREEWGTTRVLIFSEYEATLTYLKQLLSEAIAGTDLEGERIALFRGATSDEHRQAIKAAFNEDPAKNPLRILLATDAAREGLNLQAHCHNLFHFDVPWNPSRLEQRNGRIDRKLQPEAEVFCHYFVYEQRAEDLVLRALVKKTDRIRKELGSLADVLEGRLAKSLEGGIRHAEARRLSTEIEETDLDAEQRQAALDELEPIRERRDALSSQMERLRKLIGRSRRWIAFEREPFRQTVSLALEMSGAKPLRAGPELSEGVETYPLDDIQTRLGGNPAWASTLDTLRALPRDGKRDQKWRVESPIRPLVFEPPKGVAEDVVQLHLEHRFAKRLLNVFRSQGFVRYDLSRTCLMQSEDSVPRVVLVGRLSIYGTGAVRLHEEVVTVTARWVEPDRRQALRPFGRETEAKTLQILEDALTNTRHRQVVEVVQARLLDSAEQDMAELLPHLNERGGAAREAAEKELAERGRQEAESSVRALQEQKRRIEASMKRELEQPDLGFDDLESRQRQADLRQWRRWLDSFDDMERSETGRVLDFYRTSSFRVEPVGLTYLWPETG